jgi:hypothetical protein
MPKYTIPSSGQIVKKAAHANQDPPPTTLALKKTNRNKQTKVNENASIYNIITARSQANPAPQASSILSYGTVQMVTP